MKLTGELKDKVDKAKDLEEAKEVIAKAGMLLNDDEVSKVAGGIAAGMECPECHLIFTNLAEYDAHVTAHIKFFRRQNPETPDGNGGIAPVPAPVPAPANPQNLPRAMSQAIDCLGESYMFLE
jgi:hypothetical protein